MRFPDIETLEDIVQPEAFAEWLESQEEGTQVGQACMPDGCPIACYLRARGYQQIMVNQRVVQANRLEIPMPLWVQEFIMRADELDDAAPITKEMAMRFLIDE